MAQKIYLTWDNHPSILHDFQNFLSTETMVDVTLACEGKSLKAHKLVLSACSSLFQTLLSENPCKHPIIILQDMKFTVLKTVIDFMYRGGISITPEMLPSVLKCADTLSVKVLGEVMIDADKSESQSGKEIEISSSAVYANQPGDESKNRLPHEIAVMTDTAPLPIVEKVESLKRCMTYQNDDLEHEQVSSGKQEFYGNVEHPILEATLHFQS